MIHKVEPSRQVQPRSDPKIERIIVRCPRREVTEDVRLWIISATGAGSEPWSEPLSVGTTLSS